MLPKRQGRKKSKTTSGLKGKSVNQSTCSPMSNDQSGRSSESRNFIKNYKEQPSTLLSVPPAVEDLKAAQTELVCKVEFTKQNTPLPENTASSSKPRELTIEAKEEKTTLLLDSADIGDEAKRNVSEGCTSSAKSEITGKVLTSDRSALQKKIIPKYHEMAVYCRKCNQLMSYYDLLMRELIRIEYPEVDVTKKANYKFRCVVCSEIRPRKYLLYEHISEHAKAKMFLCPKCVPRGKSQDECGIIDSSGKCFRTITIRPPDTIKCSKCKECIYRPDISMLKSMKKEELEGNEKYQCFSCDMCKHSVVCTPLAITHSTKHIEKSDILCDKCL